MASVRDIAVVLRRIEYSETSQVLVMLTRAHGRVRLIAKGVKRSTRARFAPAIDLIEEGSLVFSPRTEGPDSLSILIEWKQVRSFSGLRERLSRFAGAEYLAETTSLLTEDFDPHPALYDSLVAALSGLTQAQDALPVVVSYQLQLLTETGLLPRFDACVLCERGGPLPYFSSFEGGMICRQCEAGLAEKRAVSSAVLAVLRGGDPPPECVGAFDILDYHIAHTAGRQPGSAAMLVPPHQRRAVT